MMSSMSVHSDVTATDHGPGGEGGGPAPDEPSLPRDRVANREMSWLDFNARVLAQAEDRRLPLLERLKFLAIFASNLDEFYMLRVAGLKRRQDMGLTMRASDGLTPRETLGLISTRTQELVQQHARCWLEDVEPALSAEGIRVVHWETLDPAERDRLAEYFKSQVFPVLTPLAVDPAHPFPYISGLSLNLAVIVRDPEIDVERFARVKVPNNVQRFVRVKEAAANEAFLPLEELIAAHLSMLFPGMRVVEHHLFRVTRNADIEVEEDRDEDLLQALERELLRRKFGPAVRLEVTDTMDPRVLDLLVEEIAVNRSDVLEVPGLLDLASLWQMYDEIDRPELKYRPFVPSTHPRFVEGEVAKSVFATLREGDVVVHHPYESFSTSVQRFVEQAAVDPNVLAIKQTLYRTSGDSPIVDALIDAAEAGKQVVVLVEIKARFDEQANIRWARALEKAGCHVVYGMVGLKTHCKTLLVVRQEAGTIRRYCHIGTGNYNNKTARLYEDLGLFTADPDVGADLTDLFNVLTGYSRQTDYRSPGDRACPGRAPGRCPDQDQPSGRRGDDRRALPRLPGRRAGRPAGPHVLHDPRRRAGPVGEHPGALDPRPLPGALPDRVGAQRRRAGVLDRQLRPDAPQPGPADRGDGPGHRPHRAGPPGGDVGPRLRRGRRGVGAAAGRVLAAQRRRTRAAAA